MLPWADLQPEWIVFNWKIEQSSTENECINKERIWNIKNWKSAQISASIGCNRIKYHNIIVKYLFIKKHIMDIVMNKHLLDNDILCFKKTQLKTNDFWQIESALQRQSKMHFNTNITKFKSIAYDYSNHTARKTIFPRSWNIKESSKRPRKYHLSINFLAEKKTIFPITEMFKARTSQQLVNIVFPSTSWLKKDRISNHRKVQNKNFPVISKYHISVNFLAPEKTVFPISEKAKARPFQ